MERSKNFSSVSQQVWHDKDRFLNDRSVVPIDLKTLQLFIVKGDSKSSTWVNYSELDAK